MPLTIISEHRCFDGTQRFYVHESRECRTEMRFSVFLPPQWQSRELPVLYFLAGLTCTEETFMVKAGAQRIAAELGLILVSPDTSPREVRLPGDDASWDFGLGAGFYLDATQAPWSQHYRMYSYVTRELPQVLSSIGNAAPERQSIFGHSMGGHGALICALKNPDRYRSVSAFAPISSPSEVPWGQKAFTGYLGSDRALWAEYDASALATRGFDKTILIDQGNADKFLDVQLQPHRFEQVCRDARIQLTMRYRPEYDHGYYFIGTFVEDHLRHHATYLCG
jgi:S-formylglutathione hydrolase